MFRFHFQSAHAADAFQLELTETADPEVAEEEKNLRKESETGGKKPISSSYSFHPPPTQTSPVSIAVRKSTSGRSSSLSFFDGPLSVFGELAANLIDSLGRVF